MKFWTKRTDGTFECLPENGPDKLIVRPQSDGTFVAEIEIDGLELFGVEGVFSAPEPAMDAAEKEWEAICARADNPQTAQIALDALMGSLVGKL